MVTGELKPGGARFSERLALIPEESARVFRPSLRGIHTDCDCAGWEIGKNPLGGLTPGLAVECVTMGRSQMSGNKKRANVL